MIIPKTELIATILNILAHKNYTEIRNFYESDFSYSVDISRRVYGNVLANHSNFSVSSFYRVRKFFDVLQLKEFSDIKLLKNQHNTIPKLSNRICHVREHIWPRQTLKLY